MLRQILSAPGAVDPTTGLPTDKTAMAVLQVDTDAGMKLMESSSSLKDDREKARLERLKTFKPIIDEERDSIANLYTDRKKLYGPEKAAQMTRGDYADAQKSLLAQGIDADIVAQMPKEFNVALGEQFIAHGLSQKDKAELAEKDKTAVRQDRMEGERERHDRAVEERMAAGATQKGWTPYQAEDGTNYRQNTNAGLTQKNVDGKWVDVDALPANMHKPGAKEDHQFTPKMGELMAALAEKGVALPTGFRSKEQQVALYQGILERNPNLTADDIATKVKTGEIEFGAQKKETQTAAAVAGKVEVAANEIAGTKPLLIEASKAVPREKWVPLNKLIQMADSSISDPKLKTLKVYVNSMLNAYDMLAARGGTDVEKRRENRELILSADGPEALAAAVEAFGKEADVAHAAAVKATRVPELDEPKGADKKTDNSIPDGWSVQVK